MWQVGKSLPIPTPRPAPVPITHGFALPTVFPSLDKQQNQPNNTDRSTTDGETVIATGGIQSHAGILASHSDDLFHPIHNFTAPSLPYRLPDIPSYPHYAYIPPFSHVPLNRDHLSCLPPISSSSSYDNPNFTIPPHQSEPVPPVMLPDPINPSSQNIPANQNIPKNNLVWKPGPTDGGHYIYWGLDTRGWPPVKILYLSEMQEVASAL
jgi:hypothetical protein